MKFPDQRINHGTGHEFCVAVQVHGEAVFADLTWASSAADEQIQSERAFWDSGDEITNVVVDLSSRNINSLDEIIGLESIPRIDALYLNRNNLASLEGIESMLWAPSLKIISLKDNRLNFLHGLGHCTSLEELDCGNQLMSLEGLQNLGSLKKLNLVGTFTTIDEIGNLRNLEHLCVTAPIKSLTILSDQNKLETIRVINGQVIDISSLKGISRLKGMGLDKNRLDSLRGIEIAKDLEWISLRENPLRDISSLMELPKLKMVDLFDIPIRNGDIINNSPKDVLKRIGLLEPGGLEIPLQFVNFCKQHHVEIRFGNRRMMGL